MDGNKNNVYALGARQGLWAGVYFSAIFLLQTAGGGTALSLLAGNLMIIAVPVIVFFLLRNHYRKRLCTASIAEMWMHGIMIFLCGSIILALVTYIFLKYIDPGFIYRETSKLVEMYKSLGTDTTSTMADALQNGLDTRTLPTAIQCAISFLWLGGFSGSILSLIEAVLIKLFVRR